MQERGWPAPSSGPPPAEGRSTRLLLALLCGGLLLLRRPDSLLHPRFWAEDGTLFFEQAFNEGFLQTVLRPASGYLHLFPRLVTGVALLFPMELAPLVFALAAFAAQLLPALYLTSPRMSRVIPSLPARAAAALLWVAVPASSETHVNLTNAQWHLTLTALLLLFASRPGSAALRWLESALLALFSLTGPFSVFLLPIVASRLLAAARGRCGRSEAIPAGIIATGAAIQAGVALNSARFGAVSSSYERLGLPDLSAVVSMHAFFNPVFGIATMTGLHRPLPPLASALGLAGLALLVFVAVTDRVRPLLVLGYLAALSIALSLLFPLNDPRIWLHPEANQRYALFAGVFLFGTLLHVVAVRRPGWRAGAALLGLAVLSGVRADFFHPGEPDVRWRDHVAVLRSLPAGASFYVPVVPLYHPGMVLRQRSTRHDQPPLARFEPVRAPTSAGFEVSRPRKVDLNSPGNERFLRVAGWALDGPGGQPAGGVFVRVDELLFPAAYGVPARTGAEGGSCADCGFSRLIPISEIGPGTHRVSVIALTRNGRGIYEPTATRAFALSQFFPEDDPRGD